MIPDIDKPWLPKLEEIAKGFDEPPEFYDLYPVGEEPKQHNFKEPTDCRCFPQVEVYYSLEGKPDVLVITHKWTN